ASRAPVAARAVGGGGRPKAAGAGGTRGGRARGSPRPPRASASMYRLTPAPSGAAGLRTRDGGGTGRGRRGMRLEARGGEAAIEDLYREPGKAELVNGRIVRMP